MHATDEWLVPRVDEGIKELCGDQEILKIHKPGAYNKEKCRNWDTTKKSDHLVQPIANQVLICKRKLYEETAVNLAQSLDQTWGLLLAASQCNSEKPDKLDDKRACRTATVVKKAKVLTVSGSVRFYLCASFSCSDDMKNKQTNERVTNQNNSGNHKPRITNHNCNHLIKNKPNVSCACACRISSERAKACL